MQGATTVPQASNTRSTRLVRSPIPARITKTRRRPEPTDSITMSMRSRDDRLEAALAHVVRNPVEAAYMRSDLFERRRRLMDDWEAYLAGESTRVERA